MFTATIKSITKAKGKITVLVEYSNGTEVFNEEFSATSSVDSTWLQSQVRYRIKSLQATYAFADSLAIDSEVDITDPLPPTQEEIDRDKFVTTYNKWLSVKKAIDAEVITGNETKVIELKQKVQADFKPAYLDYL